jgi:hypothetical protein
VDVFEGLGEVEILEGVIHHDLEAGARELAQVALGEPRGVVDEVEVEGGVVPPIGGDVTEFARHGWYLAREISSMRLKISAQNDDR